MGNLKLDDCRASKDHMVHACMKDTALAVATARRFRESGQEWRTMQKQAIPWKEAKKGFAKEAKKLTLDDDSWRARQKGLRKAHSALVQGIGSRHQRCFTRCANST